MFASVTDSFFDMAVKLASAGAFGICIFAMLWTGWLMKSTPEDAKNRHAALRNFMIMCVVIAVIAGTVGVIDSFGKANQTADLSGKIKELEDKHQTDIKTLNDEHQKQIEGLQQDNNKRKSELIAFRNKLSGLLTGKGELVSLMKDGSEYKEALTKLDKELAALANEK
ncbi:MAG: hypothetical protein JSS02_28860 [Planctomycetes bacterium]|nr:hypothetical protein [Planctomycetota bacterium]